MKTYRKIDLISAEQFDGSEEMINKYHIEKKVWSTGLVQYFLPTIEGDMELSVSDWIATGSAGDHWAINDDIFKKTYVEEEPDYTRQFIDDMRTHGWINVHNGKNSINFKQNDTYLNVYFRDDNIAISEPYLLVDIQVFETISEYFKAYREDTTNED